MNLKMIIAVWNLWRLYGKNFSDVLAAVEETTNLMDSKLVETVNGIFVKHGIDFSKAIKSVAGKEADFSNIVTIQNGLNALGFHCNPTGYLDAQTMTATTNFQKHSGFLNEDVDGIPGPKTVRELVVKVAELHR